LKAKALPTGLRRLAERRLVAHPGDERVLHQIRRGLPVAGLPVSVDRERVLHGSPAPPLGRDTEAVLREAGYAEETIRELNAGGIVKVGI